MHRRLEGSGRCRTEGRRAWRLAWRAVLVSALAWVLSVGSWQPSARADDAGLAQADAALQVLAADADGVLLELKPPGLVAERVPGPDGVVYTRVSIAGFDTATDPGHPALPQRGVLLAVPADARLELRTDVLAERTVTLPHPVYPAAGQFLDARPGTDAGDGLQERFVLDDAAYASTAFAPAAPAMLEEAGFLRDLRLARLTVSPLQYRPADRQLRQIERMLIRVQFVGSQVRASAATAPDTGDFEHMARQIVINPDQVASWRGALPPAPASAAAIAAPAAGQTRYRVTLRDAGVYTLTRAQLAAAGVPVDSLDPRRLSLYQGDQELAIEVEGEDDGRLDAGDTIRFYAERVRSFYTDVNTLWLVIGAGSGRRMAARSVAPQGASPASSFPATGHFEEDRIYRSSMPMASGVDHWYWGQMFVLSNTTVPTLTVPFTVEHPTRTGPAQISLKLWGASTDARVSPDHHVRVTLNGAAIGEVRWDGAVSTTAVLSFDGSLLQTGANTLALFTPGDTGAVDASNRRWESNWLDFFDLTYHRAARAVGDHLLFTPEAGAGEFLLGGWSSPDIAVYDVTDPAAAVRLTDAAVDGLPGAYSLRFSDVVGAGGRYFLAGSTAILSPSGVAAVPPSDLRAPAGGADYLIIAHSDFLSGIERLAEFRRGQGLRVRVVDVQDVYDEFSGGLLDPQAIRDFVQHACFHWPAPVPAYLLLVGDGTYDFLDHEGFGVRTFIPPYLAAVDPFIGETAADNRYVTVVGADIVPDLHLGRLPVNDQAELAAMVDKIIAYEADPMPGAWRTRSVFVADNPDTAGDFSALAEAAAAYLPPEFQATKIYLGSTEYPVSQALRAQQATVAAFNTGALLFNYVGHSSISNWAAELLFGINALPQVSNRNTYPVMLPMTCLEGTYFNPRFTGVAESLVRLSGRGALASWSPTGLGVATGHDYLHRGFNDALFNWDVRGLGPATTAGKLTLYAAGRSRDLMDTYALLGDPATRIGLPDADLSISATGPAGPLAQGDPVTYAIRYRNEGQAQVKGVTVTADLPTGLTDLRWSSSDRALSLRPDSRLIWDLAMLAPGATGQVTVTGTVTWDIEPDDLPFVAEMRIASRWTESNLANNTTGRLTADLAPADLLLRQVTEPITPVAPGERVTFTLGFANLGPAAASGVSLTLPIPVLLDDLRVSHTGPDAVLRPDSQYAWDFVSLRPGDKGRLIVSGLIPWDIPGGQATWIVEGRIGGTWPDADLGNNAGEPATITVWAGDGAEPDNSREEARRVSVPMAARYHTCEPAGDQDWSVFRAQAGTTYVISTVHLSSGGDTVLFLLDDGGRAIAKNDDMSSDARASQIIWQAPDSRDYYVMVTSYGAGAGFRYGLEILILSPRSYLPLAVHGGQASLLAPAR